MKKLVIFLSLTVFLSFHSIASAQRKKKPKRRPAPPTHNQSTTGIDIDSISLDHEGGAWLTGTAWLLRGLMVHDDQNRINVITVPLVKNISHPAFVSPDAGWAVGGRSLYKTEDAGQSWRKIEIKGKPSLRSVFFSDFMNGWLTGEEASLYRTRDGGQSWAKKETGLEYAFNEIFFVSPTQGWTTAARPSGPLQWSHTLLSTCDGGDSWQVLSSAELNLTSLVFVNATEGWAVNYFGDVVNTVDGGKNWNVQLAAGAKKWQSVFFKGYEGWAAGDSIVHTTDGGKSWIPQFDNPGENQLRQIVFADNKRGWAIGPERVLRTTDGGSSWHSFPENWKNELIPAFGQFLKEDSLGALTKPRY
jgi:photosystem II stability/assembly factor-like uncharacterized protein